MSSPADPAELAAELRAAGVGDVDVSARRRAEYSSDASLYRVVPQAVVAPRDAAEVAALVATCRQLGVPITPRGRGTSIAGNAVGPGVVIDFRRHLHNILAVDVEARVARVQPGVVLDDLQRHLAPHGLRFGPDPSTHDRCTIGGMIGNNACGSRAYGFGRTVDHVRDLEVVTGTASRGWLMADADVFATERAQLTELSRRYAASIDTEFGRFSRQVSGYGLQYLAGTAGLDVARAMVGTEGTCAVILAADIELVPVPHASLLVALGYHDMAAAADAVAALREEFDPGAADLSDASTPRITAMEGLDARIVDVVRSRRGADAVPDLPAGAGWLFVELSGGSREQLVAEVPRLVAASGSIDNLQVADPAAVAALWRIREDGAGLIASASQEPAHAGWEDAAVPPERLGDYLREFEALLDEHHLEGVPYGHFGDGCIHVRITFPLGRPGGAAAFRSFVEDGAKLVAAYGGSMSGEHGDGRARSELLRHMYSLQALDAFAAFKHVFDPQAVLNPGVIVDARAVDADLRVEAARPLRDGLAFAYAGDGGDLSAAVHRCTGVGRCVADVTAGKVMCPSYAATGDEKDSTRGRARVLQEMINGTLIGDGWAAEEVADSLDLCLACKGCASDCPTGVDMATYKAEVLHQRYRRRLRPRSHYTLGWLPRWARLAGVAPRLTRRVMAFGAVAALAKWLAGVDRRRDLPVFAAPTLTRWFHRQVSGADASGTEAQSPTVVLWADTFTDRFSPQAGIDAVTVLEDAGYRVRLAGGESGREPICCGLTWISTGQLDAAKRRLRRTVDRLAVYARQGLPIVGLEPSCTAVLREDARQLLGVDDEAARLVAASTRTLAEVLAARRSHWSPPDLSGTTVVAQPHCHQHAVMGWQADRRLLEAAGVSIVEVGGCCGLAGNFGVEQGHYDVSVAVAATQLLPAVESAGHDAVVLADGFSCRTQLDQLAGRDAVTLASLFASAIRDR